jgi:hypothetical protein
MKVEHHVYVHWSTADVGAALARIEAALATITLKETELMSTGQDILDKIAQEKTLIESIKAAIASGVIPPEVVTAILSNLDENTATLLTLPGGTPPPTP